MMPGDVFLRSISANEILDQKISDFIVKLKIAISKCKIVRISSISLRVIMLIEQPRVKSDTDL